VTAEQGQSVRGDHFADVFYTETSGHVLTMVINRPDVRNAIDARVFAGMKEAFERLDSDDTLRVGILTGNGGYFSAGMDLQAFVDGDSMGDALTILQGTAGPKKPLIAAIEGFAIAGGFETALVCDVLVTAQDAKFGFPEVKRGIFAAGGGLIKLAKRIPYHQLMDLALTGRYVSVADLTNTGLFSRIVPAGTALEHAHELATEIAANAPLALAATKHMIQQGVDSPQRELWAIQGGFMSEITQSRDATEGAKAFLEKREPQWEGS